PYKEAQSRVKAAINRHKASLLHLPKNDKSKIKKEILFIERCLDLLRPGGRMGIVLPEGIYNNPSLTYVRQFVEDRAYLKAVVSLSQETFISSGASVKASLLFLQKYTDEEKERFDHTYVNAKAEIDTKYAGEIAKETQRLEDAIAKAKQNKDAESRKALQKELKSYLKQMEEKKTSESRQLLKERFDYPIFMYEAEKVGISATGEEDQNELYPNDNQPEGIEKTCLEWYREFLADPNGFAIEGGIL
ncbi:MAG: SAM-dependent DNA methyltransferase, partial [Desulfobacteraceae bacterium]|nr:SAM-dependent DNA methyltransferase [Desulfobacteraceae bacterium]